MAALFLLGVIAVGGLIAFAGALALLRVVLVLVFLPLRLALRLFLLPFRLLFGLLLLPVFLLLAVFGAGIAALVAVPLVPLVLVAVLVWLLVKRAPTARPVA